MAIYIINYLSLLVYSFFLKRKFFCLLSSIQMFSILALRSDTLGVDLPTYELGFDYISNLNFNEIISVFNFFKIADLPYPFAFESGWVILNWFIAALGLDFHSLLVICAAINMGACGYFFYKYSPVPLLSFAFITAFNIYTYMFGILRQSLAISLIIFAIDGFEKRQYKKSVLFFILAFTIHRASIIALVLFLLMKIYSKDKKIYVYLSLCWIPFAVFSNVIYAKIIFPVIVAFGKGEYVGHSVQLNNLLIFLVIINIGFILFYDFKKIDTRLEAVSVWSALAALYWETFGLFNDVLVRNIQFFTIFLSLSIPQILTRYRGQRHDQGMVSSYASLVIYALLFAFLIYSLSKEEIIVPYMSIFD